MHMWIIGCRQRGPCCPVAVEDQIFGRDLEWDFFHVRALQCAARFFPGADAALLAAANDAARQVSGGVPPAVRCRSACSRWPRREARNLGSCGFGWRGCGFERSRRGAAPEISEPSRADFDDHEHGAETRRAAVWRGERVLLSPGLRLPCPSYPRPLPSGTCVRRPNGIL